MFHGKTQFPFISVCVCVWCVGACMFACMWVHIRICVGVYICMQRYKVDLKCPPPLLSTLYLRRQGLLLNLELNILARPNTRMTLHFQ